MTTIVYLPTDEEALEGIGPWTVETNDNLAGFEQDRVTRLNAHYAHKRQEAHSFGSQVNGSIGGTRVPHPGFVNAPVPYVVPALDLPISVHVPRFIEGVL